MDFDTAYDEETTVDVNDAVAELSAHGFQGFFGGGKLMVVADNPMDMAEIICDVEDGQVSSRKLLQWLGY